MGPLGTMQEAAERLGGVSLRTVRRRIADGTIDAYRVGQLVRVDMSTLDRAARPIVHGD